MYTEEQRTTGILLFGVFVAVTGNSFLHGYNIGVVDTPALTIQAFYNKTYYERAGGNWTNVQQAEECNKAHGTVAVDGISNSSTDQPVAGTNASNGENCSNKFGVKTDLLLDKWQLEILWSVTVALFVFFGMIGASSSARVADFFGRKKRMIVITFIMFVAAILGGIPLATKSPEVLMLSRAFVGIHSGLSTSLCPMYLAEISPRRIRGAIGTCHWLAITTGILFSQILGLAELSGNESLWPLLFAFYAVPSLVCLVAMPFCPESPRYLLIQKGLKDEARKELIRIRGFQAVEEEMEEMRVEARKSAGVMTYSTFILQQAQVSESVSPYVKVGTDTIKILASIIAVPLREKAGRRPLLIWSMCVMTGSLVLMTIFLNLMKHPDLVETQQIFAYVCMTVAHTCIIGFALGLDPIPSIVVSEIFRQEPRAGAMSLSQAFVCNFVLILVFPFMQDGLKEYTYIVFSVILGAAIAFIFFFLCRRRRKRHLMSLPTPSLLGSPKGKQRSMLSMMKRIYP